jgi:hypothetical protein
VGQLTVDPDDRPLTGGLDRGHPRLDHRIACSGELVEEGLSGGRLRRVEALRQEGASGDGGLDHDGIPAAIAHDRLDAAPGRSHDPLRRHDVDAAPFELAQVRLVGVKANRGRGIEQA